MLLTADLVYYANHTILTPDLPFCNEQGATTELRPKTTYTAAQVNSLFEDSLRTHLMK